jgi:ABC-type nitrate/sulfonate/bicarbonate transport system substrate-binding protein
VAVLEAVAKPERLARLRSGAVDVALIDLASLVDTVAAEPGFDARCVFVLGRHTPMSALFVEGRPAPTDPISSADDLVDARYGGEATSQFVQEHRALLRRLGGDDPALHVEVAYGDLFGALAAGTIDAAPDYAGILPTYQRAAGAGKQVGVLPYRDCGVSAYGTGLVATGRALREQPEAIAAFLAVAASAYEAMRAEPEATVKAASTLLPEMDADYALTEWREEEEPVIFDAAHRLGDFDRSGWEDTIAWRREVAGFEEPPEPDRLYEMVR